jgi:acetyltransferase-like isoleucine patch superfamily enzyme
MPIPNQNLLIELKRKGVRFELNAIIDPRMDIRCEAPVKLNGHLIMNGSIGAYTYVGLDSRIAAGVKKIGRYCSFAPGVIAGDSNHEIQSLSTHPFQWGASGVFKMWSKKRDFEFLKPITKRQFVNIGNDVWIGANSMIMRGVTIGDGAVIGGGSIVTKDVPPYAIVVGVPAKIIRYRFTEKIIEKLLALRWWRFEADSLLGVNFNDVEIAIDEIREKEISGKLESINTEGVRVFGKDLLLKSRLIKPVPDSV